MAEQHVKPSAHNFQDLTGRTFDDLRVLCREIRNPRKIVFWRCVCVCGREKVFAACNLTSGRRKDCGCKRGVRMKEAMKRFREENPQPTAIAIVMGTNHAVIVDHDDYSLVAPHCWIAHRGTKTFYARAIVGARRVLMHVLLMGEREGMTVDHINGNGLDNRRANLRWATPSGQCRNTHGGRGRSLYKGVSWAKRQRKWIVTICVDGKNLHLGYFDLEDDAARAYDVAARSHYGEFASLNFPGEDHRG